MSFVFEVLSQLFGTLIGGLLFLTGELLLKLFSLGRHRVRWWEVQDNNVTLWPCVLGAGFWAGVFGLVYYLV